LRLALFVSKRDVFFWSEDVCVEPESDLVIVSAPVVVVDDPSSSARSSCSVDQATLPGRLSRSEATNKTVGAMVAPGSRIQSAFGIQRSRYLVTIALAPLRMSRATCKMQGDVAEQAEPPLARFRSVAFVHFTILAGGGHRLQ
jgi:hypothetical protein